MEENKSTAEFEVINAKMQLRAIVKIQYGINEFSTIIGYGFPDFNTIDIDKEVRSAENPEWLKAIGEMLIKAGEIASRELQIL